MVSRDNDVGIAMALVIGAGAATGIGASVVFFPSLVRFANNKTLAAALGLSAGVMTYVSFAEVFIKSTVFFEDAGFSEDQSKLYSTLSFFAGIAFMVGLNQFVTWLLGGHHHGGHQTTTDKDLGEDDGDGDDESESLGQESASVPPCICHDEHPRDTLNKVKEMAYSMAEHPDRPHVDHGQQHHRHEHRVPPVSSEQPESENQYLNNDHEEETHERRPPTVSSEDQDVPVVDFDMQYEMVKSASAAEPERARSQRSQAVIDVVVQEKELPENIMDDDEEEEEEEQNSKNDEEHRKKLLRVSLNTALAIGLHNFPEGLATFVAALDDPKIGGVLAVAIAIHNIPEGLCVAMPIYYATGNRWKAFGWALLSGVAEPVAGLLGWLILSQSFSDQMYGLLFGLVGGMMVIISARELLPTAHRYDPEDTVVTYAFIAGMGIMALSLMLFLL
ncbi:hypothetical protein ACA910_009243 [Epithemia clementina (nom. ined.)]